MAALRKSIQTEDPHLSCETEVIYLLIPPHTDIAPVTPNSNPWSFIERAAFVYLDFRLRARETPIGRAARAVGLVAGYTFMVLPLLVGGYLLKSAIGFDAIPGTHMGGYIPDLEWRPGKGSLPH